MALIPPTFKSQVVETFKLIEKSTILSQEFFINITPLRYIDFNIIAKRSVDDSQETYPVLDFAPNWEIYYAIIIDGTLIYQINGSPDVYFNDIVNSGALPNVALYYDTVHPEYVYWQSAKQNIIHVSDRLIHYGAYSLIMDFPYPPSGLYSVSSPPGETIEITLDYDDAAYTGGLVTLLRNKFVVSQKTHQFIQNDENKYKLIVNLDTQEIVPAIPYSDLPLPKMYSKWIRKDGLNPFGEPYWYYDEVQFDEDIINKNRYTANSSEIQTKLKLISSMVNKNDYNDFKRYAAVRG